MFNVISKPKKRFGKPLTVVCFFFCIDTAASELNEPLQGLHTDISVGVVSDAELSINIAFPQKNSGRPRAVVLMVHGGGFTSVDKDSKNQQLTRLAKRGIVAASAMYRLSPQFKYPAQVEDIKLAVRFLKANAERFNIDPNKIVLVGSSAGSYLAAMVGVTGNYDGFADNGLYTEYDASVRAVAIQSGPVGDLSQPKHRDSKTITRLLAEDVDDIDQALVDMTPATYLDAEDPPFFIVHGDSDPVVSVEMSREFVQALVAIDHPHEYHEVAGGTHSLRKSSPDQAKEVFAELTQFIRKWAR